MTPDQYSQMKRINNKIKLYASINPISQLDTLKNKGSSYSKKNF